MNFNRRSFLKSVSVAFGAAIAVKVAPETIKQRAILGERDGDKWFHVSWYDGQHGKSAAIAGLRSEIEHIGPSGYIFMKMELPKGVDYAENEIISGVPMRHVRIFDPINIRMVNRLDVFMRRIV